MSGRFLPAFLAVAALAAPAPSRGQSTSEASSRVSSGSEVTRTSRPVRLLRSWEETVKDSNGRDSMRRVDVVFDYGRGAAREEFFDASGRLTGRRPILVGLPPPSPEEVDEAFGIVSADPEMQKIIEGLSASLTGGFVIEEARKKPCGPGSRCLLILVTSKDHTGLIRRLIVDLVRRDIPYRTFEPGYEGGIK